MHETLQKMTGAATDVPRIAASGREDPGVMPDDMVRRLMDLED